MWLIYPRHGTPISVKIGQHLLKLCTKVFWCVFYASQCSTSTSTSANTTTANSGVGVGSGSGNVR